VSPLELRALVAPIELHKAKCDRCRLALETQPKGRYPTCRFGDFLLARLYRRVYELHMEAVKARRELYGSARDPYAGQL